MARERRVRSVRQAIEASGQAHRRPLAHGRALRFRPGWWLAALLVLVGATAGAVALQRANPPPETVEVVQGAAVEELTVDALITRQEQVVTAPQSGQVHRLVAEGERVRVESPVVEIGPGTPGPLPAPTKASTESDGEFDRLSTEIYRLAVALNQAIDAGDGARQSALMGQLAELARQQEALAAGETLAPPAAAPAASPAGTGLQVVSQVAGLVLFQTDGLEGPLSLEGASQWTPATLRGLPYPARAATAEGAVTQGEPLFKVVDDLEMHLLAVIPSAQLSPMRLAAAQPDGLPVRLAGQDRQVRAQVRRVVQAGEETLLHLTVSASMPEAFSTRRMRVTLLFANVSGMLVPRSAIDVQEGKQGLWLVKGSSYQFVPVLVTGGSRDQVVVQGGVSPGDEVLREVPPPGRSGLFMPKTMETP